MLNDDYKQMLQCLSDEDVKFLLVGAYALAVHGFPRWFDGYSAFVAVCVPAGEFPDHDVVGYPQDGSAPLRESVPLKENAKPLRGK